MEQGMGRDLRGRDMVNGCKILPVTLASTSLFGAAGVVAGVACFAEVAGKVLFRGGGAIGEANVVTVGGFVGAGHLKWLVSCWLKVGRKMSIKANG